MKKEYRNINTGVIRSFPEGNYNLYKNSIYKDYKPVNIEEVQPIVIDPIGKVEEVNPVGVEEVLPVWVNENEEVKDSIEALRSEYFAKTGKQVSNKFKNDSEWIKSKIDGL